MNLKWASDALDELVMEANKIGQAEAFNDVPIDTRHIEARRRKQKKGDHRGGLENRQPSIRDFPPEWLPDAVSLTTVA